MLERLVFGFGTDSFFFLIKCKLKKELQKKQNNFFFFLVTFQDQKFQTYFVRWQVKKGRLFFLMGKALLKTIHLQILFKKLRKEKKICFLILLFFSFCFINKNCRIQICFLKKVLCFRTIPEH